MSQLHIQPDPDTPAETPPESPAASGTRYWRSLEQIDSRGRGAEPAAGEFADGAAEPPVLDDVSRRKFLGLAAATAAVAGMTSCRKPVTRILPFARRPEDLVPGNPRYYATAHTREGFGTGVLVKSSDGRPTKIEGNPLHGSSLGATDHLTQAELLNLYDPARSHHPIHHDGKDHAKEDDGHGHAPVAHPTIADFVADWQKRVPAGGAGLRILMEPTSSPSVATALAGLKSKYPNAVVHHYAPVNRGAENAATIQAFGKALNTHYDLTKADVVVAVDADFQSQDGDNVRNARDYAKRRKITSEGQADSLSRLYVMESFHSVTGSNADHRFRLRPSEIGEAVMALAHELKSKHGLDTLAGDYSGFAGSVGKFDYNGKKWIPALAKDLAAKKGKSALVIGPRLPVAVQVVLHALNHALGNAGTTVTYTATPAGLAGDCGKSIADLAAAMDSGSVKALAILGGNPVYNAPAELTFQAKLAKVGTVIHLSQFVDETSSDKACTWHINQAHDLETWGDIASRDGTVTLMQPLIAPLYDGVSTLEMLGLLADGIVKVKRTRTSGNPGSPELEFEPERSGYDVIRASWKPKATGNFETWWARALHDGTVPNTKSAAVGASPNAGAVGNAAKAVKPATAGSLANLEVQFRPGYNIYDGRYTNNSWLMELPDPMTKLTWDNAVLMSLGTMNEAGLSQGDLTEVTVGSHKVTAPVWVLPGHADHTITLTLGYGRELGEDFHAANGAGYNAFAVRTVAGHDHATGAKMSASKGTYELVVTQEHGMMEGRALVREGDADQYKKDPQFAPKMNPIEDMNRVAYEIEAKKHDHDGDGVPDHPPGSHDKPWVKPHNAERPHSLWPTGDLPKEFVGEDADGHKEAYSTGLQWGMVIDLNSCIGCNACVSACVSENNIPVVGKAEVANGREMFWNRIDRYFGSDTDSNVKSPGIVPSFNAIPEADNPKVVHQMVPCMQCENASCEVVCPVAATSHSPEGLNDMAYNRCIGTRYCGNNCPYKVRRFNYLDYKGSPAPQTKMARNPDVTIRSRGVMEKCTYCVQRINRVKIEAKREFRRDPKDGEIQTACEQACPTEAITFGNINDKESRVAKLKASNLNYGMLAELNMRPRTTYLAKIRNPNPELVTKS